MDREFLALYDISQYVLSGGFLEATPLYWTVFHRTDFNVSDSASKISAGGCEFTTVFVSAPDIKEITGAQDDGTPFKSIIGNLSVLLDGKPNFFRSECSEVSIPPTLNQKLFLDDMNAVARGNGLKNYTAWIEKSSDGKLVGRTRGQLTDSVATYVIDIHRFIGKHSMLDVWVGSPPDTFPSEGNLIFLKEIRRNGKSIY